MSELGHDFRSEFPADHGIFHELKLASQPFRDLAAKHHALVQQIYRIEGGLEATSDERLEEMKKLRLGILDKVAGLIATRKAA